MLPFTMNLRALLTLTGGLLLPALAAGRPAHDRTVLAGTGRSMLPALPEACRLVVVRVPFEDVHADETDGDVVATRLRGINVVHRAIGRLPDGSLITRGDNNPGADAILTTARNYVGIVVGFEEPGSAGHVLAPVPPRTGG